MAKKILCPLMQSQCIEDGAVMNGELHSCRFWIHVLGKNPQTGKETDMWDCAFAWLPVLLIENSSQQRTTGAEVNKLRNEIVPQNQAMTGMMAQIMGMTAPMPVINASVPKWIEDNGTQSAAS